jgi:hypothetical protein
MTSAFFKDKRDPKASEMRNALLNDQARSAASLTENDIFILDDLLQLQAS